MNINFVSVLVATIVQFVIGALWYSVFFGKLWGKIHGFDKLPENVQKKLSSQMGPFYGIQFIVTLFTSIVLYILNINSTNLNIFTLAFYLWIGLVVPAQVSSVIFSNTDKRWMLQKILVMSFGTLACLVGASLVYNF